MNVLLDTSAFIWLCDEPERLSPRVKGVCDDKENELFLSFASVWEIQIKVQLGKLRFEMSMVEVQREQNRLILLPIELRHIYGLKLLPSIHGDPFDRLLISQAREINATIVTCDEKIKQYPVNVIW